jgi:tRNA-specific 2-thiouridylase
MSRNFMPKPGARIAVAMSGGVDSSVAAYLLSKAGYDLVGLTAWTLNGPGKCCNDALVNAGRVCETLGIPYDTVDLRAEFSHFVMDYYNNSYEAGVTPNPCVECNRYVKWEQLVRYAVDELGVDYVATGHYAILEQAASGGVNVLRSADEHKDQTYMMTRVYPKDLARTVFPLGEMTKPEVVALARAVDLPTAYSKESQDICFVLNGQGNYMDGVFGKRKGVFVDFDTGKTLGEHDGYYRFTLGQRKGMGVAAGRPVYVVKIDPAANTVYLGDAHHLDSTTFTVLRTNWLDPRFEAASAAPFESMVKIRYNTPPTLGLVEMADAQTLRVTLQQPVSAITPGQIAAFYDPAFRQLYGGGYIERHLSHRELSESDWQDKRENLPDLYCQV